MKGVSPLIATALLILISIAASAILWVWVSSMIPQTPPELPFMSERVKIEAVNVNANTVEIFVRNLMDNEVRIGSSYIINGSSGLTIAQNLSSFKISGGDVIKITIELKTVLPRGVYIAKVTTARGYEASYVFAIT